MIRKLICILFSIILMTGFCIPALARSCSGQLQIIIEHENNEIITGEIVLCQVAQPSGEDYLLLPSFGSGLVKKEDAYSDALAAWLSELSVMKGHPRILDVDGIACYTGLQEGLYLVKSSSDPDNEILFDPFLISVPYNGSWNIGVVPSAGKILTESPKTGQHFSPLISAMGIVLCALAFGLCVDRYNRK